MQIELYDAGTVPVQVSLQISDRPIPVVPKCLLTCGVSGIPSLRRISGCTRAISTSSSVRSIEDADPAAFRQVAGRAPKKIMLQLSGAGMLEAEDLNTLRIDPRHHMPDGAVLSCCIHRLEDQQDSMAISRIKQLLQ